MLDTLTPPDDAVHRYEALFHLGTAEAAAAGERAWTLGDAANLHIVTAGPDPATAEIVKGQEEPYYLGWIGTHGIGNRRPMPVARFSWAAAGVSRLLHVLYPTRPGEALPIATVEAAAEGDSLAATVAFADGRRDRFVMGVGNWQAERRDAGGRLEAAFRTQP